eukprot:gene11767-24667_t
MSRSGSGKARVDDLWTKLENTAIEVDEDSVETTILFVGDSQCGKTTIIQSFLTPSTSKDPKPTFALEYSFARKKAAPNQSSKSVCHIWELGGDIYEPSLLEIPLATRNIGSACVVVCCDLSKYNNVFASVRRWIGLARSIIKDKLKELKSNNPNVFSTLKARIETTYQEHVDKTRVRPCEVPIYIICNKYDKFKDKSVTERRAIIQALRFIAHYHGASLICTTSTENSLRETCRTFVSCAAFRTSLKSGNDTAPEKPFYVTAGKDTFESILIGSRSTGGDGSDVGGRSGLKDAAKDRLLDSDASITDFITDNGVTDQCWKKLDAYLEGLFGQADASPEEQRAGGQLDQGSGGGDFKTADEFAEPEVDESRRQRDEAL